MESKLENFKAIGKEIFKLGGRIFFYTGIATLFNWVLILFLIPELMILGDPSALRGAHAGGGAAILVIFLFLMVYWKAVLVFLVFFVLFPFLHFLFSKKYAISKAIQNVLKDKKSELIEYFLRKFFERMKENSDWIQKIKNSNLLEAVKLHLPIFINRMDGMPFSIKMLFRFFLSKIDILGILSEAINSEGELTEDKIIEKISFKVNSIVDEKLFSANLSSIGILYLINSVLFVFIKIYF